MIHRAMNSFFKFSAITLLALGAFVSAARSATETPVLSASALRPRSDLPLLREALRASGVEERERGRIYEPAFESLLAELKRQIGSVRSDYRRAKKLHQALHQRVLLRYESTAD